MTDTVSFSGYGGVPPVDGLQNLDLNAGGDAPTTNPASPANVTGGGGGDNLNFDPDSPAAAAGGMPSPPQDNNQVAAWYDTDL